MELDSLIGFSLHSLIFHSLQSAGPLPVRICKEKEQKTKKITFLTLSEMSKSLGCRAVFRPFSSREEQQKLWQSLFLLRFAVVKQVSGEFCTEVKYYLSLRESKDSKISQNSNITIPNTEVGSIIFCIVYLPQDLQLALSHCFLVFLAFLRSLREVLKILH